jgi:sugar lactone lactonase YvrE
VALDASGTVYIADTYNHTIRKVTAAGVVTTLAGTAGQAGSDDGAGSAARFNYPSGVAVDASGSVYIADTYNHTIRTVTPAGVVTTLAGNPGQGGSDDGAGAAAHFYFPLGLAVDASGNVYVADTYNQTIRKVTPEGQVTTLAGTAALGGSADGMGAAARFEGPHGVAVDTSGTVYVADTGNHTIRKVTPAGVVTTLAGAPGEAGSADGTGAAPRFDGPSGVAADASGNVYVADTGNNTIRKVTPAGVVSTVVGTPSPARPGNLPGPLPASLVSPRGVAVSASGGLGFIVLADAVLGWTGPP